MTMLKKVAQAILEKNSCNECCGEVNHCGCAMGMAKAAIEAMRELPSAATRAGHDECSEQGCWFEHSWAAAIDAALKEAPDG